MISGVCYMLFKHCVCVSQLCCFVGWSLLCASVYLVPGSVVSVSPVADLSPVRGGVLLSAVLCTPVELPLHAAAQTHIQIISQKK